MNKLSSNSKIAIVGLGYVGLPLAVEFSKKYNVIGFDINAMRIQELQSGIDKTLELETSELKKASNLKYTSDLNEISDCTIYIIGVPTPVNENNEPDFTNLISASKNIGKVLKKNDIVIFESTVYPGATEEICVPELAKNSNLTFNKDFYVGYSPERINPGDKSHRLTDIIKVTSGSTQEAALLLSLIHISEPTRPY